MRIFKRKITNLAICYATEDTRMSVDGFYLLLESYNSYKIYYRNH